MRCYLFSSFSWFDEKGTGRDVLSGRQVESIGTAAIRARPKSTAGKREKRSGVEDAWLVIVERGKRAQAINSRSPQAALPIRQSV
jgi:hypothetical protein